MTKFVCDNCGAINENPEHVFKLHKENPKVARNKYFWQWGCEVCQVMVGNEHVSEKMKDAIKNEKLKDIS